MVMITDTRGSYGASALTDVDNIASRSGRGAVILDGLFASQYWRSEISRRRALAGLPATMLTTPPSDFDMEDDDLVDVVRLVDAQDDEFDW